MTLGAADGLRIFGESEQVGLNAPAAVSQRAKEGRRVRAGRRGVRLFAQPKNLLCKQCADRAPAWRGPSVSTANKGEAADRTEAHKELQFITGNNEATANTPPASSPCVRDALRTTLSL